jgi:Sec-independent protein secretion pathway component TatC
VAAVISPGTDVVSQCLMAFPMLGLYAISILVAWIFGKPKAA